MLDSWFAQRGYRPSEGLRSLFGDLAWLAREFSSNRHEISTRFLFFAVAEAVVDDRFDDSEGSVLRALQAVSGRDSRAYQVQRDEYFRPRKGPAGIGGPAFTPNVEKLLNSAIETVRASGNANRPVMVADVLLGYPPEGSKARGLLAKLGIDPNQWRDTVVRKAARPTAGRSDKSSSPDADQLAEEGGPAPVEPAAKGQPAHGGPGEAGAEGGGETSPTAGPAFNDSVTTHADEPALIDQLERLPFAAVLARNIRAARASGESEASAFVVHLHGPWGSGKSSVLNFLEAELKKETPPWLVVRFNAWRDQRRQPPWWSLITCIYAGACKKLDKETSKRLWWRWFKWRVRADFMPWVVSGALVLGFAILLILGVTSSIGPTVSAIGGTLTLIGAGAVAVRSLALGSQRAAQTYADLKSDPFQPMTTLFDRLIDAIGRPVAVFIDDLDRCDSGYVVELLEGIQTLMRSAPVTYVVAADRKWICSSFEQRYAKFSPPIGEPGRPLGYLFLDKMFQVSAAVPQLAPDIRSSYWQSLLRVSSESPESAQGKQAAEDARRAADDEAKAELANLTTHEELRGAVERAEESKDPLVIQATRAEAAMRISSAEASIEAEHRLKGYSHLLEPNPRSMKRLVNAYGMHQATLFLAGRSASPDALARWTILELRWPLLADFLAVRPNYVDRLRAPLASNEVRHVPDALRDLFGDELVVDVIGQEAADNRLHPDALRSILGAVQGDR